MLMMSDDDFQPFARSLVSRADAFEKRAELDEQKQQQQQKKH